MDSLLDRLWELANEEDEPRSARRNDRVTEAQALWRALEVLLTSLKPQELNVGDGTFIKTLACVRSVLSDPGYWKTVDAIAGNSEENTPTVFVLVNRVLLKIGCRGEQEREALMRDGIVELIVHCGDPQAKQQDLSLSAFEGAAALQTLQALAVDAKTRATLQVSHAARFCIRIMQKHGAVFAVQLRGCQFLHQMTLEEDCKERVGRYGGVKVVADAVARFAEEAELVIPAFDVLFFLCVELDYRDDPVPSVQFRSVNSTLLHTVVNAVVDAMHVLQSVELVQANGVAVLNSIVMHAPVKQLLCSLDIWGLTENGLSATATDEAACDFVDLLDSLLRDPMSSETLRRMLNASTQDSQEQSISKSRLKALKSQIDALRHSQVASKENGARMAFVTSKLQSLLDEENSMISSSRQETLPKDNGERNKLTAFENVASSVLLVVDGGDELPVDVEGESRYAEDTDSDYKEILSIDKGTEFLEEFLQDSIAEEARGRSYSSESSQTVSSSVIEDTQNVACISNSDKCVTCFTRARQLDKQLDNTQLESDVSRVQTSQSGSSEAEKWQALYEGRSREVQRTQQALHDLEERYRVVLRRSQEQSKLLALQNARIASHANEQQQIIRRMRSLEASLDEADRRCQVERALRSAEAAQCEQLSVALNESMREAKSLAAQQSSAARELQQKETMRTEYMMRSRESKQDKQRVEIERDNALLQIEILKQEKADIVQQLADCKREGLESLLMREEDTDALRKGVFSELLKAPSKYPTSQNLVHRRNSLPAESLQSSIADTRSSVIMATSTNQLAPVHPLSTHQRGVNTDLNDDPSTVDTAEIQNCLVCVFQALDSSADDASGEGVHVTTVRRFFMECGLVQPPNVLPADVDVVLYGVLAQAQSNRKNYAVRKDFSSSLQETWAPPVGWAKTKKRATMTKASSFTLDAKRFRFFNQDAFNEAVTLVGMRRYPRSDLLSVLQTVVALYLRPYLRQQRMVLGPSAASISGCGSSRRLSVSSPSQICSRAMRTILNGLALHLGHHNENEYLKTSKGTGMDEGEIRCHAYSPTSVNRSHKREDVVYSMLEMSGVLTREQQPLGTICEFYSSQHLNNVATAAAMSITKTELFGLSFEIVLNFAIDFEVIPAFMDRLSLKHLHTEVAGLLKSYFALHDKDPPSGVDAETLKKVAFGMILARLAIELFSIKANYETPEQQITGLLQWLDSSPGREKIMRKAGVPLVIRFSRQLYAVKT